MQNASLTFFGAIAALALTCGAAQAADYAHKTANTKSGQDGEASAIIATEDAAFEQDEAPAGWYFEANSGFVSDYRYRGISLTDRNPALQFDATVAAPNGIYVFGWASQYENDGEGVELMGALGWSGNFFSEDLTLDLSGGLYAYPGVSESSMFEFGAKFTRSYGDVEVSSGVSYMPEQATLGDLANTYVTLGASSPLGLFGASGSLELGWERGAFAEGKIDWMAAVEAPYKDFTFRIAYAGAARQYYGMAGEDTILAQVHYALRSE